MPGWARVLVVVWGVVGAFATIFQLLDTWEALLFQGVSAPDLGRAAMAAPDIYHQGWLTFWMSGATGLMLFSGLSRIPAAPTAGVVILWLGIMGYWVVEKGSRPLKLDFGHVFNLAFFGVPLILALGWLILRRKHTLFR